MGPMNKKTIPTVGMPCTVSIGSDRYAGVVAGVSPSKKTIMVEYHDGGAALKFMWKPYKTQEYRNGKYKTVTQYRWKTKGQRSGYGLYLGKAENYQDPSY